MNAERRKLQPANRAKKYNYPNKRLRERIRFKNVNSTAPKKLSKRRIFTRRTE